MLLCFLIILFTSFTRQVLAQEATPAAGLFETYKTDYLFQQKIYQEDYLDYFRKKQIHTQYGTLITQKDKNEATIKFLITRNTMLKAYLLALRVKLDQYEAQNPTDTEIAQIGLSKLEEWLVEQNTILSSINNESDTSEWAETFKNKYTDIQQQIYTSLVQNEANQKTLVLKDIKKLADDIKNSPKIKPESQQWFSSLPTKSDLVISALNDALKKTQKSQYSGSNFQDFYSETKIDLNKANGYLAEMVSNLKSIVVKFSN